MVEPNWYWGLRSKNMSIDSVTRMGLSNKEVGDLRDIAGNTYVKIIRKAYCQYWGCKEPKEEQDIQKPWRAVPLLNPERNATYCKCGYTLYWKCMTIRFQGTN